MSRMDLIPLAVIGGLFVVSAVLITIVVIYEHHHPCLRYSSQQVFVPEFISTTWIVAGGGVSVPITTTTPAHYETETVCEERK